MPYSISDMGPAQYQNAGLDRDAAQWDQALKLLLAATQQKQQQQNWGQEFGLKQQELESQGPLQEAQINHYNALSKYYTDKPEVQPSAEMQEQKSWLSAHPDNTPADYFKWKSKGQMPTNLPKGYRDWLTTQGMDPASITNEDFKATYPTWSSLYESQNRPKTGKSDPQYGRDYQFLVKSLQDVKSKKAELKEKRKSPVAVLKSLSGGEDEFAGEDARLEEAQQTIMDHLASLSETGHLAPEERAHVQSYVGSGKVAPKDAFDSAPIGATRTSKSTGLKQKKTATGWVNI